MALIPGEPIPENVPPVTQPDIPPVKEPEPDTIPDGLPVPNPDENDDIPKVL